MNAAVRPAIDLGATRIRLGLVDCARRAVHAVEQVPTPADPAELGDALAKLVARLTVKRRHLGVALAAELDAGGVVTRWPNRPAYVGVSIREPLEALGFAPHFLDDGLAACVAAHNPGKRPSTTLYVGLGTGVAGGAVISGMPLRGANGGAMDVGHLAIPSGAGRPCVCGRIGCLQTIVSARAVEERCRAAGFRLEELGDRARAEEPGILPILAVLATALAEAIHALVVLLDPDTVVLDAGLLSETSLLEDVRGRLGPSWPRLKLVAASCSGYAPLIGAAVAAVELGKGRGHGGR